VILPRTKNNLTTKDCRTRETKRQSHGSKPTLKNTQLSKTTTQNFQKTKPNLVTCRTLIWKKPKERVTQGRAQLTIPELVRVADSGLDEDLDGRGGRRGSGHGDDQNLAATLGLQERGSPASTLQLRTAREARGETSSAPSVGDQGRREAARGEQQRRARESAQRPHWRGIGDPGLWRRGGSALFCCGKASVS
jgi:hypothetical protein